MLYLAQVLGIPIAEVAVEWQEIEGVSLNVNTSLSNTDILLKWIFCLFVCLFEEILNKSGT